MNNNFFSKFFGCLIVGILFTEISNSAPKVYSAIYSLKKGGIEFARSKHDLSYNSNSDEWCITSFSYTVGIFSIKKDGRNETSCFKYNKSNHLDAINSNVSSNDFVRTNTYTYNRTRGKKNHAVEVKRINDSLVTVIDGTPLTKKSYASIDRLVAQLFGYTFKKIKVNDKGRERQYNFKIIGKETISTIFGPTESIVVSKKINESKRNTLTWYSINNDYIPVVVEQYRIDEHKFTATLIEFQD